MKLLLRIQNMWSFKSLRRVTNSGIFIPEIDGLRFIAIAMVVLYHLDGFLFKELVGDYLDCFEDYNLLHDIILHGYFGVEIFFSISAFVVALPFAYYYFQNGKKISISDYFIRRLTRIEPPYLISLFLILAVHLWVLSGEKFSDYTPSFYYSLIYSHGFFYHRDFQPLINNVAWSLEIEIQFYIIAPLLFYLFFKLIKVNTLNILLLLTLLFSILTKFPKPNIITLYEYFQYFLLGISIAYMKVNSVKFQILENFNKKYSQVFISIIAFILMLVTDITFMGPLHTWFKLILSSFQIAFMFILFYNLLISNSPKLLISKPIFTIFGGMCYSIYLFHNQIIMSLGHYLLKLDKSPLFILDYIWIGLILFVSILLVCTIFFILVERPCMDKKWPLNLILFIKKAFFSIFNFNRQKLINNNKFTQ